MQWSKLRSHLLTFVAPGLRKRIDFHLINYRKLSELANEFLITVDGQKAFSASYSRHNIADHVVRRRTGLIGYGDSSNAKKVDDILAAHEIHAPCDITSSIRTYLDLDPQVALSSNDPILKALAIVHRRIGRRTLKSLEIADGEHSPVKTLYALRMESLD